MYATHSQEETGEFGTALGKCLQRGDTVLLRGDLGAGKSVLARGIARALGVKGAMASPTFTLMQPYEGALPVYHFDLYRLNDIDEYYAAGLDEFVGADGVALVEWPPEGLEASPCVTLELTRGAAEDSRRIRIGADGMDQRMNQIARALAQWEEKT